MTFQHRRIEHKMGLEWFLSRLVVALHIASSAGVPNGMMRSSSIRCHKWPMVPANLVVVVGGFCAFLVGEFVVDCVDTGLSQESVKRIAAMGFSSM